MNAQCNAPISDRFSSLCARVFYRRSAILKNRRGEGPGDEVDQFLKTQTNFVETQTKRLGTCSVIIREPGKDSFPGFSASNMATSNML